MNSKGSSSRLKKIQGLQKMWRDARRLAEPGGAESQGAWMLLQGHGEMPEHLIDRKRNQTCTAVSRSRGSSIVERIQDPCSKNHWPIGRSVLHTLPFHREVFRGEVAQPAILSRNRIDGSFAAFSKMGRRNFGSC